MKEYEQVRSNLIEMLEELDDRLAKITRDVKHEDMDKNFNATFQPIFEPKVPDADFFGKTLYLCLRYLRM